MLKSDLVDSVVRILSESGFNVVDCRGSRSSFDVLGKRDGQILLVKALANVEGLSRGSVSELKAVSSVLGAVPVIVSQRMKNSELVDGAVYDRYGVYVSSVNTLSDLINDGPPSVYSTRGNYCVHVNIDRLIGARKRMGYTQDSLAEALGVSKQSVYRYERSGRISLDVFERLVDILGDDLVERDFTLGYDKPAEQPSAGGAVTSFKRLVAKEFEDLGFRTSLTNAPFDIVASMDERVFSVVSNDWRRLADKLEVLDDISGVVGGYTVCISERRVRSTISVLSPRELAEVKSSRELFKLLKE